MPTGSIRPKRRADGSIVSWQVVMDLGPDPSTGERRRGVRTFPTEAEAVVGRIKWLAELEAGTAVARDKVTVREFLREWLQTHETRPTTKASYRSLIEKRIIPALGAVQLQKLTHHQLDDFYQGILTSPRLDGKPGTHAGARTARLCHAIIHRALEEAMRADILAVNPADKARPPRYDRPDIQAWTEVQAERFLAAAAEDDLFALYVLALETGMRQGELLGLRWCDVDLVSGTLSVRQAVSSPNGHTVIQPPKTNAGKRNIKVQPETVEALQRHARAQFLRRNRVVWHEHDLVFPANNGNPMHARNLMRRYYITVERAKVPPIHFHALRHTAATMLLAAGVHANKVKARLGHSSIKLTMDTYSHVTPEMDREASDAMGARLFRRQRAAPGGRTPSTLGPRHLSGTLSDEKILRMQKDS